MSDDPLPLGRRSSLERNDVRQLAAHVLSVLATEAKSSLDDLQERSLKEFCDALIHPDDRRRYDVIGGMVAAGVTTEEILERFVPNAARRLGEHWVDDTLSFAEVSVGAARLQEVVRAFGNPYEKPGALVPLGRSVLMIVPDFEKHTLGPFLAASQFRRYGLWVQMAIGLTQDEIVDQVAESRFSMIGISCSNRRGIEGVARLVDGVQTNSAFPAPVVVGGNVVMQEQELKALTGADLVTIHPREALDFCQLAPPSKAAALDEPSGILTDRS
ncbi:MAG: cobalamin B12-binding domain-containing protein [Pseudomonadota bacterium]